MRSAFPLVLAAILCTASILAQTRPDQWVRDSNDIFRGNAPLHANGGIEFQAWHLTDLRTGASLPEGRVHLILPLASSLTTVMADEDGWARSPHGSHFVYADAPGYAPLWCGGVFCGTGYDRFEPWRFGMHGLVPGYDVPIQVRDILDRPLAGARVEARFSEAGEASLPIRSTVTDTEGRCILPSVDLGFIGYSSLDVVIVDRTSRLATVFEGENWRQRQWQPGRPPLVVRAVPPFRPPSDPDATSRPEPNLLLPVIVTVGGLPSKWGFERHFAAFAEGIDHAIDEGDLAATITVRVPARGRCAVHLRAEGRTQVVEIPPEARAVGAAPLRVRWFEPAQLTVRLLDAAGAPVDGWAATFPSPDNAIDYSDLDPDEIPKPQSEHVLSVHRRGEVWLQARANSPWLRPVRMRVFVPPEGTPSLGPVTIQFPSVGTSRVQIRLPDDRPAAGATLQLMRAGLVDAECKLNADGALIESEPAVRTDDVLRVEHDEMPIPWFPRVDGPGPWGLRWPKSGLVIRMRSAAGTSITSVEVVIDRYHFTTLAGGPGRLVELREQRLDLPGIEAGPHRLVISAPGHRARIEQLVLKTAEVRTIDAVLTPLGAESRPTQPR